MSSKHTLEDQRLIDSLLTGVFTAFRSSLRNFLKRGDVHSPPPESPPTRVKLENDTSATRRLTTEHDKAPVKTRLLKEGEREVVEILSDSEVESEADDSVTAYQGADPEQQATVTRESSPLPPSDIPSDTSYDVDGCSLADEPDMLIDLQKSDTIWQDQQITSQVCIGEFRVTKEVTVERVEYLDELASIYPIPKTATAFLIDVDDPKFAITDKRGDLYTVDALIKNKSVKLQLTGKPVAFKCFVAGGNILAMNSDMEAAQVLGAARSFLKMNDPKYSQLSNDTPGEQVAPEIIKLCTTHAKRAVLDFKSLVSREDYDCLMDFVYIDSAEKLEDFSNFVRGLGVKIQALFRVYDP
ncbi:hypothetical protein C8R44DRAFT_893883 [Mycena epipterygia]|nr:hypothetical protein C8R44DRAFT_893883 [Mycena epipterygia]